MTYLDADVDKNISLAEAKEFRLAYTSSGMRKLIQ